MATPKMRKSCTTKCRNRAKERRVSPAFLYLFFRKTFAERPRGISGLPGRPEQRGQSYIDVGDSLIGYIYV
jgi:hypothetical protein